ncbi:MAG: helix-turn-helix domain-containing protein [Lachnospiraceae bacterium]|nr:helix-turn-helix domain-containing protein [Lachnospiraceae bacterium]
MKKDIITEETLGQRIRTVRKRMGITQEELAERMHFPKSTISAYENDKIDIKGSVIAELAQALASTPNYLLGVEVDPETKELARLFKAIKDSNVREALLVQIRALSISL